MNSGQLENHLSPTGLADISPIPESKFNLIFLFMVAMNMSVNMPYGSFSCASKEIELNFGINPSQFGTFGAVVYFGCLIGSILTVYVINRYPRKYVMLAILTMSSLTTLTFILVDNLTFTYFNRFITGILQAFVTIYCPIWVDQFSPSNRKTFLMSVIITSSSLGTVFGFITIAALKAQLSWKSGFILQSVIYAVLGGMLVVMPRSYFSRWNSQNSDDLIAENRSLVEDIKKILRTRIYVYGVLAFSVIIYVSTFIQYWTPNYTVIVLKFNEADIQFSFVVICITAPLVGIIGSSFIVQRLGGYEDKRAILVVSISAMAGFIIATPQPFLQSFWPFIITLWLFLCLGSAAVPTILGVIISSVSKELRPTANSVSVVVQHVLGFIPAPYVYGSIYQLTKDSVANLAYALCLYYSLLTAVFLMFIVRIKYSSAETNDQDRKNIVENDLIETESTNANSPKSEENEAV